MKLQYLCQSSILIVSMGLALSSAAVEPQREPVPANNYPTLARVEYVNQCINNNGGKLAALYQCSCVIDRIANALPYDDYVEVTTFVKNANLTGQGGGMFRDSERGKKLVKSYRDLESESLRSCGVSR